MKLLVYSACLLLQWFYVVSSTKQDDFTDRDLPPLVPPNFRVDRQLPHSSRVDLELIPAVDELTNIDDDAVRAAIIQTLLSRHQSDAETDDVDEKRAMGMLRMGRAGVERRAMGMLRMGRSGQDTELESKRTMGMLRMGRNSSPGSSSSSVEQEDSGDSKRAMGMLRMGRAMGMLRMGRSVDSASRDKKSMSMLRMGR